MKLGVVGTGMIVQMVIPNLASWGIEMCAVAGTPTSMDQVADLIDKYGAEGCTAYEDFNDMVKDPNIDTVYVAVPNFLHAAVSRAAFAAGKNVVCEKPLASNVTEARALVEEAKAAGVFFWEAVVTTRQPNFKLVRDELLPRIGDIKLATVNYSQYSSRYDAFRAGEVLPAFDPAKSGGAIMDIGLYALTYTLGLFGEPKKFEYHANIERDIDTSGVVTLDYDGFKALAICAKDCGFTQTVIQGTEGHIISPSSPNVCGPVTLHLNDGTEETYDQSLPVMWEGEFLHFKEQVEAGDLEACYAELETSLLVSRVQTEARIGAGVHFPSDEE